MSATETPSPALELAEMPGLERLKRKPIIDTIEPRTLALIQSTIAPNCTPAEVGHFLELCAHYGLDPFAKEAWCAKSDKGGKLLIMVGRDGLRRIAQRNGLHVDGDVVRAKDEFTICRTPDGNRTVTHSYGNPAQRGDVIGAWAECRMGGPLGKPMGYFYAPLSEYRPANASGYSPWSKQVGVMILAAAERQAIRQATPLGGLLAVGEDDVVNDNVRLADGTGNGEAAGIDLGPDVEAVIARATSLGHPALADRATIELTLGDQPPAKVVAWVRAAKVELDKLEHGEDVTDAVVVEHKTDEDRTQPITADVASRQVEQYEAVTGAATAERITALRRRGEQLLEDADALDDVDPKAAADKRDEWESVVSQIEAAENADQTTLGGF